MSDFLEIENFLRWDDFTRRVRDIVGNSDITSDSPKHLFRGQSSRHTGLEASFDRLASSLGEDDRLKAYDTYVSEFGATLKAREYVDVPAYLAMAIDEVAAYQMIAQHHGAPTRLLDWSSSPYVAAYFAASSADAGAMIGGPLVWVLDVAALRTFVGDHSCKLMKVLIPGVKRPLEQFGWFTQNLSPFGDLVDLAEQAWKKSPKSASSGPIFRKLVLDTTIASHAMADLAMMGISAERLFPDLEGMAREFRRRIVGRLA